MKWHCLRDKNELEQLRVYWDKGANNEAAYFTKQYPQIHYSSNASSVYTYLGLSLENYSDHKIMQGCVETSPGYSFLYQIPEGDTSKTTMYDKEMSYGQTVKLP